MSARTENRTMFRVLHVFPRNLPDRLCISPTSLPDFSCHSLCNKTPTGSPCFKTKKHLKFRLAFLSQTCLCNFPVCFNNLLRTKEFGRGRSLVDSPQRRGQTFPMRAACPARTYWGNRPACCRNPTSALPPSSSGRVPHWKPWMRYWPSLEPNRVFFPSSLQRPEHKDVSENWGKKRTGAELIGEIREKGGRKTHQHQHVWDRDHIRLVPYGHGWLKVVPSVFPVGHCVVFVKCDVVLLDAFSEFTKKKNPIVWRNLVAL